MTHLELLLAAYQETGLIDPLETLDGAQTDFGLQQYNRLLDQWNAVRDAVYVESFAQHTLTAGLNPHTFGPSGATFTVTQRPVSIEAVRLVLTGQTPSTRLLIMSHDWPWYADVSVPALSTSIPTHAYYAPNWPNGSLYLWPVPDTAYPIEVWRRVLLAEIVIADIGNTFSLPPGYRDAIVRTLAENIALAMNVPVPASLSQKAADARAIIFANNVVIPKIQTRDSGMPNSGHGGDYNYLTNLGGGRRW